MKTKLFAAIGCMTITSCIDSSEILTKEERTGIDVSVGYQVNTRALSDAVTSIDWLLLDGDGAVVSDGSQTKSASNFGTISIDAEVGDYKLVLLATKMVSADYNLSEEGVVTTSKVADTFAKCFDVTIGRNERGTLDAQLPRVATKLNVKSADKVSTDITKFDASLEGIALTYDIVAGEGGEATSRTLDKTNISKITTNEGYLDMVFFAFVPEASSTDAAKITINLYNSSDEKVKTLVYENIPMEVNKTTTLTAAMFHAIGADATVSVDAEWGEGIDIER